MILNAECEHHCGWLWPFGFVPEGGCPVHDVPDHAPRDGRLWEGQRRSIALWWPVTRDGTVYVPMSLN